MARNRFVRRLGVSALCLLVLATGFAAPAAAHGCQHATTTTTATPATATGTETTPCPTANATAETRSTGADETTAAAHTADTQISEDDAHASMQWTLTTIQFFSAAAMMFAAAALCAAVLAYRGTD